MCRYFLTPLFKMKISLNWLGDYINLTDKDHQHIKDVVTTNIAEVETLEQQGEHLENVVVGKVVDLKKHPNADSLSLVKVNDGEEDVKVVCGGSNLRMGMLVAFAKLGAVVRWHGGEVVKMEKAKIRGEESFGMICAAEEIGLEEMFPKQSEKEIVDLTPLGLTVGEPLAEALGLEDIILDIDNHAITNRADLFSHRGFAREFVASGLATAKKEPMPNIPADGSPNPISIDIRDTDVCSRYMSVYMTGIEVKSSPDWIKKRLSACGIRPINNIVDITNYVMLDLGMPVHAFDTERVKGKEWVMRKSKKGEKVTTLDEQEHELMEDVIVMEDGHEIFDLCGIMGGATSGIQRDSSKILVHVPVYNPTLIRRAMRGLGHISDAAIIYEKGVDDELASDALARCMALILELCPEAKVASRITDIRTRLQDVRVLPLDMSQVKRLIGIDIPVVTAEKILDDLGFSYERKSEGYTVTVPSWRLGDIERQADLIEEIARVYGYNNIPEITPVTEIRPTAINKRREMEKKMKNDLVSFGFDEVYNFAFLGPELMKKCEMTPDESFIEVANPISSDMSLMRQSLLPRIMENIADNLRYQQSLRIFEMNPCYVRVSDTEHEEKSNLMMATAAEDIRALQGAVEAFGYTILPAQKPAVQDHPGRAADIVFRGQKIGHLAEIHPQILKNFDIKTSVCVASIDLEAIHTMNIDARPKYQELSKFPSVKLDVSIAIPKKKLAGDFLKTIETTDKTLIADATLIDEYTGEKIADNQRALTFSVTYQAADRTLKEEEVNAVHAQVLKRLKANGAEVR